MLSNIASSSYLGVLCKTTLPCIFGGLHNNELSQMFLGQQFKTKYVRNFGSEPVRRSALMSYTKSGIAQCRNFGTEIVLGGLVGSGAVAALASFRYHVSGPDEYLVRTGLGIDDMIVSKKGFQWPFQTYQFIRMHPTNYSFDLQAMSSEKMEFVLPGSFTIGPYNDIECLKKYSRLLQSKEALDVLVKGIVEGETRIQSASMTLEQIFNDRKAFKEILIKNVQEELDQFGLKIYNANIRELQDSPGSEYFSFLRQQKRSQAENRAKVDVAEAQKLGDIGQKEREAMTRQQIAQYEANTVLQENSRRQEIEKSHAELNVIKAIAQQKTQIAYIEAENSAKVREAELQREVEQKRIAMETEKLRAIDLAKSQVGAEAHIKDAEGAATSLKIKAEAELYAKQKEADAILYTKQKEAEALLFFKQNEAKGITAVYEAQSDGLQKLIDSFGGNQAGLIQYLMLDRGLYERLAQTNADAIKGLNPKITIWNTNQDGENNSYTKPIADIIKMVPPLVSTINDQTGITPPSWLVNLPPKDTN